MPVKTAFQNACKRSLLTCLKKLIDKAKAINFKKVRDKKYY